MCSYILPVVYIYKYIVSNVVQKELTLFYHIPHKDELHMALEIYNK